MRIVPVTGDLPAVVACTPPPLLVRDPPAAPPALPAPADVTPARTNDRGSDSAARRQPAPPFFDPPLIAQRAALGLPVGPLIAELATSEGISYGEASAAVDRALPDYDASA